MICSRFEKTIILSETPGDILTDVYKNVINFVLSLLINQSARALAGIDGVDRAVSKEVSFMLGT